MYVFLDTHFHSWDPMIHTAMKTDISDKVSRSSVTDSIVILAGLYYHAVWTH